MESFLQWQNNRNPDCPYEFREYTAAAGKTFFATQTLKINQSTNHPESLSRILVKRAVQVTMICPMRIQNGRRGHYKPMIQVFGENLDSYLNFLLCQILTDLLPVGVQRVKKRKQIKFPSFKSRLKTIILNCLKAIFFSRLLGISLSQHWQQNERISAKKNKATSIGLSNPSRPPLKSSAENSSRSLPRNKQKTGGIIIPRETRTSELRKQKLSNKKKAPFVKEKVGRFFFLFV